MAKIYDGNQPPQSNLVGPSPRFNYYSAAAIAAGVDLVADGGGPCRSILFLGAGTVELVPEDFQTSSITGVVIAGQGMDIRAGAIVAGSSVAAGAWVFW